MGADAKLCGMDDLLKWADETGNRISSITGQALQAGAQPILEEMQHTSAFVDRTGHLRGSLKVSKTRTKAGQKFVWVGDVDGVAKYAWPLERGTSKMKAHPFMRPAFERQKGTAQQIISEKIKEAIK